jgi:L-xylulokinase
VIIPDSVGAPLGAAILAGKGVGFYSDVAKAVASMVRTKRVYEPSASQQASYARLFDLFKRVSGKFDEEFRDLSQ